MDNSSSTVTSADTNNTTLVVELPGDSETTEPGKQTHQKPKNVNLCTIFSRLIGAIVFSHPENKYSCVPLLYRIKKSFFENVPLLKEASKNSAHDVLQWARRGSPLRAILVVSVGTIASLILTGLLVFMLFFVAAIVNAIVISLLVSLAAAGGFLAMFFASVTAIYIAALSVAASVISIATISAIAAVTIATGWIGFFWTVWLATRGSFHLAKRSLNTSGSVLSAYSVKRYAKKSV